jgi:hypothetical protein
MILVSCESLLISCFANKNVKESFWSGKHTKKKLLFSKFTSDFLLEVSLCVWIEQVLM